MIPARKATGQEGQDRKEAMKSEEFKVALRNVPEADIDLVKQHGTSMNREDIARALVMNRWENPICESCYNKTGTLRRCKRCCLAFYCNRKCQVKHWQIHKIRCGNKHAPVDEGPQKIVFVKTASLDSKESFNTEDVIKFDPKLQFNSQTEEDRKTLQALLSSPANVVQILANAESRGYVKDIPSPAPREVLSLVFPSIRSLLLTFENKGEPDKDQCLAKVIDQREALEILPNSGLLSAMGDTQWGFLLGTMVRMKMPTGEVQENVLIHSFTCYNIS